ncbi:CHAD domain-containing protein [Variovorax sp. LG9.2]|uniref:CYTH and CHAD domain-containing protein n=1 Tax=Variovorax sp. LG9.2 TaxID=3048626 RepID=UPI002B235032|nr:CHAD domain-containing protein [Variovorax sp. LG9.2]MEB0057694.1 CHAD domain-containing protein [Variovorax sp. LG9.2]
MGASQWLMRHSATLSNVPADCASREVELKLLLSPSDVDTFRTAVTTRLAPHKPLPGVSRLHTTYFDTPDLFLRRQGLELRVRKQGGRWTETVKTIESSGRGFGLHDRGEWEAHIDSAEPDLAALRMRIEPDARPALILAEPGLAQRLVPVFDVVVRRSLWQLSPPEGTRIELTLDEGELRCGAAREPICEVEFELKAGAPAALFDAALLLQDDVPLRIGRLGKADRGYALLAGRTHGSRATMTTTTTTTTTARVTSAQPVLFARDVTVEQGFQAIIENCSAHAFGNEAGVMRGTDPESVHQMRVGIRRLRSALRLFSPIIPTPALLGGELRWLSAALGAARDAEVLAGETLPALTADSDLDSDSDSDRTAAVQWTSLLQTASLSADTYRSRAAHALASPRYARLTLGLAAWLGCESWQSSSGKRARKALQQPLHALARGAVMRLHRKLRDTGKRLARATPEQRHRVRIAAKRLRYAIDSFQSLYPSKATHRYVRRLGKLQDALGQLNDAQVAGRLLHDFVQKEQELEHSVQSVVRQLDRRSDLAEPELLRCWKAFRRAELP